MASCPREWYAPDVAAPTFAPYWDFLGRPSDAYPPKRLFLVAMSAEELDDCVPLSGTEPLEELGAERAFGRVSARSKGKRPSDRDRRFARIDLARPTPHPMWPRGHAPLSRLPILPAGLRESPPSSDDQSAESLAALDASYERLLRANATLARVRGRDGADAFRAAYAELLAAGNALLVGDEASLLQAFGVTPEARWARLLALAERAESEGFDPVWLDDLETHTTVSLLAALGFHIETRP